jgi:phosphoenolpyruvate phosphomutase / 2-hydroxyethylphosphonate cytidylyltransferase|tara:strand:- start:892 stop:1344 length:453 start_codon:yes stop_codon:yes gene_type:complete
MKKKFFLKIKRPYVFVPMCLDFMHHGHVNILNKAKKYGNIILGLMKDEAISKYKNKPLNSFKQRKTIALSLKNVKKILPVNDLNDFLKLSQKYKFDYFVHGDDWKKEPQSKTRKKVINLLKEWKGKVIDIPYTKKISSTLIKSKLNKHGK